MEINDVSTETTTLDAESSRAFTEGLNFDVIYGEDSTDTSTDTTADAPDQGENGAEESVQTDTKNDVQDYVIKYKGKEETLHLTADEHTTMLQKGRDYDEVRRQRDEYAAKTKETETLRHIVSFFARNNGMPYEDYISGFAQQASDEGIKAAIDEDYPDLPDEAKQELFNARKAQYAADEEAKADAEIQADIEALKAVFPDADINNLPEKVQEHIGNGVKPVDAMIRYDREQLLAKVEELTAKLDALNKEKESRKRSPGRADSSGDSRTDPFIIGFGGG